MDEFHELQDVMARERRGGYPFRPRFFQDRDRAVRALIPADRAHPDYEFRMLRVMGLTGLTRKNLNRVVRGRK